MYPHQVHHRIPTLNTEANDTKEIRCQAMVATSPSSDTPYCAPDFSTLGVVDIGGHVLEAGNHISNTK
jgi:hypothetical protein